MAQEKFFKYISIWALDISINRSIIVNYRQSIYLKVCNSKECYSSCAKSIADTYTLNVDQCIHGFYVIHQNLILRLVCSIKKQQRSTYKLYSHHPVTVQNLFAGVLKIDNYFIAAYLQRGKRKTPFRNVTDLSGY